MYEVTRAQSERWAPGFDFDLKYYLSGPMAGYPERNFKAFAHAAEVLRNTGVKLLSAHEIDHGEEFTGPGLLEWHEYLKTDLKHMLDCQGIILLRGWPQSKGARLELHVALYLEYPVWYYDDYRLTNMNRRNNVSQRPLGGSDRPADGADPYPQ